MFCLVLYAIDWFSYCCYAVEKLFYLNRLFSIMANLHAFCTEHLQRCNICCEVQFLISV